MLDHWLRGVKDQLLAGVARRLGQTLHPTLVTLVGLGVGLAAALLVARGLLAWGLLAWLLNRLLDGLDGTLARLHDQQSDFGGYLDLLCDFAVYALLPIALAVATPSAGRWLALALLLASFYVNAASWMVLAAILEKRRAAAPARLTTIEMPSGLIGGTETILFYCLFLLFPLHAPALFMGMAFLVLLTIAQRVAWAAVALREA